MKILNIRNQQAGFPPCACAEIPRILYRQLREAKRLARYPYVYRWGNNPERAKLKGRRCRIVTCGKLNSTLLEFEDGSKVISSRNAIRKARP